MSQQPISNSAREAEGLTTGEGTAIAFAVGWVVVIGIFFWVSMSGAGPDSGFAVGHWVLVMIAVFVPAGLIWIATLLARTARHLREDLYRTQAEVHRLSSQLTSQQTPPPAPPVETQAAPPAVETASTAAVQPQPPAAPGGRRRNPDFLRVAKCHA
ncbi:hypothetical protein QTO30_17345 [Yoonia sp. GPGPB17]|uniref:hypothetical protein n=1 Tax=Yoonia sp. GPGPB17 TaxID=3026147 RepID=UPI0030C1A4C4